MAIHLNWKNIDGYQSQINSPLTETNGERMFQQLKLMEAKPRPKHASFFRFMAFIIFRREIFFQRKIFNSVVGIFFVFCPEFAQDAQSLLQNR